MYLHLNPGRAKDCCCCYVSCRNKTLSDGSRNLTIWECYPRVIFYTSFSYSTSVSHQALSFFSVQGCSCVSVLFSAVNTSWVPALCHIVCSGCTSTPISNVSFSRREYSMIEAIIGVCLSTAAVYRRELLCQGRLAKVMLE